MVITWVNEIYVQFLVSIYIHGCSAGKIKSNFLCFVWHADSKKIGPKSGFFVKFLALLVDSALLNRIAKAGVVLPDFTFSCVGVLCMNWTKCFYFCVVFPHFKFIWEFGEDRRLIYVGDLNGDCWDAPGVAGFEMPKVHSGVCGLNAKLVFWYCFKVQGLKTQKDSYRYSSIGDA